MSIARHWRRDREPGLVKCGHERVFFQRGEARHVHPRSRGSVAEIITVGLDGAEGDAPQAVDFQDTLVFLMVRRG